MHQENHQVLHYATLSLVFFTLLSGFVLSQHTFVSATDPSVTATATVHVAEACTLSANNTSSHNAEMSNGTYEEGIGSTTFNVKCNDASGFALYAIGYSNEEYGNTDMIGDSTSLTIPTGTEAALGSASSHWSMKVTKDTTSYTPANLTINNSFDSYHVVPDTYTKVATYTTGTDGVNGTGSSVIATYDARISATQAADSYVGKVKFTLVHPSTASAPISPLRVSDCPANSICYAPNAGDIEGTMISGVANTTTLSSISNKYPTAAKQTQAINANGSTANITSNSTATLVAPNFKREGYGFAGWSTDFTATNSSTIYGPNETINTGDLSTNGLILYPVWVESTGNLQEFSCASSGLTQATYDTTNNKMVATLSSVTALTDSRDGNVYAVARLADNQCWMIENLRLNSADSTDSSLAQGFGGTFAGLPATTDSWNISNNTLAQLNTNNTNATIMGGTGLNASSASLVNTPGYPFNTSTAGQQGTTFSWYSYGNNYSWAAAMANTNSLTSYTASEGAGTSICPHNWHLPYGNSSNTGNTAGGFYYLNTQMSNNTSTQGSKNWRMFPNNFIYSGYWYGSSASDRGSRGIYWSSSVNFSDVAFLLQFYSDGVDPGTGSNNKYFGYSVRCVAGS